MVTAKVQRPEPQPFIAARIARLRAALEEHKLPALLVTNFADVSYLTGFEGDDSFAIVTPESVILISDTRYEEQIQRECPWVEVVMRPKLMLDEVVKQIKKLKLSKIGVQSESMTLRQSAGLVDRLKGSGKSKVALFLADEMVVALRHIKDAEEIAITERAIVIAQDGLIAVRPLFKPGVSENEIASVLVHNMRKRGASDSSFETIVGVGANSSLPHYRPKAVPVTLNTPVLVDWGARYSGYCSDLTRVIFVGNIPPQIKEIYQIVLEAQLAAIAAIKPGMTGKQVDKVARDIIAKAGYGDKFGHGLGHGIGRDIHEPIALNRLSTTKLKPGMIITVEPGIYLPGLGGVRIEDDVLVTETGHRVLSTLPKSLEWAQQ